MGIVTTVLEIAGAAALVAAGFLILPAVGFAVLGLSLIAIGYLASAPRSKG